VFYPLLQAHGRQYAATKDFLEEKAGQPETIDPLAGQVSGNDCIRMANGPASESTF